MTGPGPRWRVARWTGLRAEVERAGARLSAADPPAADAVTLTEATPGGLWRLEALIGPTADLGVLARAAGVRPDTFAAAALPDQDWTAVSLAGLPAVRAGRFTVRGGHVPPATGGIDLLIEAGQAFGTGHHGTTWGCLAALDAELKRSAPRRVLDMGCGAGVLAIAAAKSLRRPVTAVDNDAEAVATTRANARANGVARLVAAVSGDGPRGLPPGADFDLVFANILAGPLIDMAGPLAGRVARGGALILSGLLIPQTRSVAAAYRGRGLVTARRFARDGWATLVFRAPPSAS